MRAFVRLIASLLFASPAVAQSVPNLLGRYEGSSSITMWGCTSPSDNKTTVAAGWVDITEQTGSSFSGEAEFSTLVEGASVSELLTMSGTVTAGGSLGGSAASQGNVDGTPSGSGQADFSGTFAENGIELQFPGGAVGIDGCNHGGARISGNRCGNGVVEASEQCDDGNQTSEDGCTPECISEFCGDGVVQSGLGEVCDDGNSNPDDACDSCMMIPEPDTTLFRLAGVFVLGLLHRRRVATGRGACAAER
jgi:cysteine-rich repeat protein